MVRAPPLLGRNDILIATAGGSPPECRGADEFQGFNGDLVAIGIEGRGVQLDRQRALHFPTDYRLAQFIAQVDQYILFGVFEGSA